ncbi:MAG: redox-sensing transcriptional repressor Rex [Microthrixaceae bacterium]
MGGNPVGSSAEDVSDDPGIPDATVSRLPLYHRALLALSRSAVTKVSSEQLAEMAGVNAAKVRKDLSYFGSYGTRGVGYEVDQLLEEIRNDLGLGHAWRCVLIGVGNLGSALISFAGFRDRGFDVVAAVDVDPDRVGTLVAGVEVHHQDELGQVVETNDVAIGILTTPPEAAQPVADALVAAGVRSILSFAPTVIEVPSDVVVRHVDVASELEILAFHEGRRMAPVSDTA